MHGPVAIRSDGSLTGDRVQLWNDKRCAALVEEMSNSDDLGWMMKTTANAPATSWTGFKLQWLQRNRPEVFGQAHTFLVPKDFINFRLTGEPATDPSEASGSYMFDASKLKWSTEAADRLGLETSVLPEVVSSHEVIGVVTAAVSTQTGLSPGTPVVAGGGDMLCTLLGSGLWEPGIASDITGTSSLLSTFAHSPVADARVMNLHHVCDAWVPFGIVSAGGLSLSWYLDHLRDADGQPADRSFDDYDSISARATAVSPGAEGLLFFPYLLGERTLGSPYSRGALVGLTPRHSRGSIVRAIMEGVTFELRRALEVCQSADSPVEGIIHSGGGASSDLWSQIKADIYQLPVSTLNQTECGLFGSAALAAVGAGMFTDPVAAARRGLRTLKTFEPNPDHRELYDELFEIFRTIHESLQQPYRSIAASKAASDIR